MSSPLPQIGLSFLAVAGVDILLGLILLLRTRAFLSRAVRVPGRIVDYAGFRPVAEYRTEEGQVLRHTPYVQTKPLSFQVGDPVDVFYLEKNPEKAKLNWFFELWFVPTLLVILSLPFFILGIVFLNID